MLLSKGIEVLLGYLGGFSKIASIWGNLGFEGSVGVLVGCRLGAVRCKPRDAFIISRIQLPGLKITLPFSLFLVFHFAFLFRFHCELLGLHGPICN